MKITYDWVDNLSKPCGYLRDVVCSDDVYAGKCAKTRRKCVNPHNQLEQVVDCDPVKKRKDLVFERVVQCLWESVPKKNRDETLNDLCGGCSGYDSGCEFYIGKKEVGE